MKKNNFLIMFLIVVAFLFNSCASVDPYKYKDSRMVFKIDVGEPQIKETKQSFYLINKKITILPFIDNRNFEKTLFATDIPLSLLFSRTLYKNLYEDSIFKKTELAEESVYKNKTITFDENNFPVLKNELKTDAVIWGIIYEFDIVISPDKTPQQYILTLHMRGDIKIMSDNGTITYYHDFNKTRSYLFKTESFFSYTIYHIKSLGPFINNFLDWIIDGEINHLLANSGEFIKGKLAIENLIPDVLSCPQENTKLYDASVISSALTQKWLITGLGSLVVATAGFFAAYCLSGGESNNPGSGLYGILVGTPVGLLSGFLIINYITDKIYEKNEKKAIFYALNNRHDFTFYFPVINLQL